MNRKVSSGARVYKYQVIKHIDIDFENFLDVL